MILMLVNPPVFININYFNNQNQLWTRIELVQYSLIFFIYKKKGGKPTQLIIASVYYLFMKYLNNVFNWKVHIYIENIDILQYIYYQ